MYYTISIDQSELEQIVSETQTEVNKKLKKYLPFRIYYEEEEMPGVAGGSFVRFRLVVMCAPYVDDKQALLFTQEIDRALAIVQELNEGNYTIVRPPSKYGGPRG